MNKPNWMRASIVALACGALPAPVLAVTPANWTQSSEADFKAGRTENVVATNLGDLKLSRALTTLLEQDPRVSAVYALLEAPDGSIYAATGPRGVLLRIADDQVRTAATIDGATNLTALALDAKDRLLIGTAGERGRIYRQDEAGQPPVEIFAPQGVQYVWAMTVAPDGFVYAATGPEGQLFEIAPDGAVRQLLDTDERNLLSLIGDGKQTLYVGTHPDGLLYKVDRKTGEAFVLYDAQESEISALALDARGNVYAATAQAAESTEGGVTQAAAQQIGRPESDTGGAPIPSQPPKDPTPPPIPDPNPGEPAPIPKNHPETPAQATDAEAPDGDAAAPVVQTVPTTTPGAQPAGAATGEPAAGNAIYRVNPQGFVTEIFRQPVTVLSLLERDGTLLAGTGGEGVVYQVDPSAEETAIIAKVDPKQVTALLRTREGRIYLGLSNAGGLAAMSGGYARQGTYTSAVLDATQISRLGRIHLHGTLPEGTQLTVRTRSGNLQEPTERGWSAWTEPVPASAFVPIASPAARFFQYQLILQSPNGTATPVVDEVNTSYQIPNLPPRVEAIVTAAAEAAPAGDGNAATGGQRAVAWQASDPNSDKLLFSLYFRRGSSGPWIALKEDFAENTFVWETRQVGDGRYYLKVAASDARANEPGAGRQSARVSDPVEVDNTPPLIGDLKWQKLPKGVQLDFRVTDRTSTVASIAYTVDANDRWQTVLPVDKITDGPDETVSFRIAELSAGTHQVTIRATDAHGNAAYENVAVVAGE